MGVVCGQLCTLVLFRSLEFMFKFHKKNLFSCSQSQAPRAKKYFSACVCEWDWKSLGLLNINSKRLQGSEFLGPDFSWWFRLLLPLAFYFCGEGGFLENYKITIISVLIYNESFLS